MKYVSIDIETLGLDPDVCDVIEFGAVIEDLEDIKPIDTLPTCHCYVTMPNDVYRGNIHAMKVHAKGDMFEKISSRTPGYNYVPHDMLGEFFFNWLVAQGMTKGWPDKIIVGGKNFMGFDMRFLRRLPNFEDWVKFHHRAIDPAPMYMRADDKDVPSLQTCLERAGIQKSVSHTAVEDAIDVIRLIRHKLCDR
jgi:oligoribonuclease (3'-5' exoribonuclease)